MLKERRKNLRFKCIGCGECCRRPGEVRFGDETFEQMAQFLSLTLEEFRQLYKIHFDPCDKEHWVLDTFNAEPCPFLVEDRCSVHPVRPRQCRTYPFWPEILESYRTWTAEQSECPGIGIGPVFDEDTVLKLSEAEEQQLPVSRLLKLQNLSDD